MNKISGQMIIGIIIILLGVMFFFDLDVGKLITRIGPLALIGFGLYLILSKKRNTGDDQHSTACTGGGEHSGIPGLIGDIKVADLKEGVGVIDKKLLFGNIFIDLTDSKLLEGENIIDTALLFGDITLIVPEDYPVKVNLAACIGDLEFKGERESGFFPSIKHTDEDYTSAPRRLRILGKICFGDIRVFVDSK